MSPALDLALQNLAFVAQIALFFHIAILAIGCIAAVITARK